MKYKGKYLANVAIDFEIAVNDRTRPFDKIKKSLEYEFTPALQEQLKDELFSDEIVSLEVVQRQAELWKEGEESETD